MAEMLDEALDAEALDGWAAMIQALLGSMAAERQGFWEDVQEILGY